MDRIRLRRLRILLGNTSETFSFSTEAEFVCGASAKASASELDILACRVEQCGLGRAYALAKAIA
jgi:hypothetical protein